MLLLPFLASIMSGFHSGMGEKKLWRAYSPGDIMIGGLFPIHDDGNMTGQLYCRGFDASIFLVTQAMIYTIEEINRNKTMQLPKLKLGYDIYDTCGNVSIGMLATLQLLRNGSNSSGCFVNEHTQLALPDPETKAVIGALNSEVSVAVARVTALSSLPQISYGSTSEALSNKFKFPTFLRTVPSDKYQTRGIFELVEKFNWKTVAIIGSDDEYGKYGSDSLVQLFKNSSICIEFIEILPDSFSQSSNDASTQLADLVNTINYSFAEAIIIFTKTSNVDKIMEQISDKGLNRTWIASDSWATSTKIITMNNIQSIGRVFGFIPKRNRIPSFEDYVKLGFNGTNNSFLKDFLHNCSTREDNCSVPYNFIDAEKYLNFTCLANYIDHDLSYNTYLAVHVVLKGLRNLLMCNNTSCARKNSFTAAELLTEIKKVNLTLNNTNFYFDDNGDPSIGYDIVRWNVTGSKAEFETVGEYWNNIKINVEEPYTNVTVYGCHKTCRAGQQLEVGVKTCCNDCVNCKDGEYSPGNGAPCKSCSQHFYPSEKKDLCLNKTEEFLKWSDAFSIILINFAGLGIIVTLVFVVLFAINLRTPIVKAVGGKLCFLELLSLLACFCISFTFIGKPTKLSCMAGLPVFSIAFSICISCILSNLFQILVGFSFELRQVSWLKKLNQPLAVVFIVSGIQASLCVSWLNSYPPYPEEDENMREIIEHECEDGSTALFIATICYNALLAFICLMFAVKGKKLPDLYKNARLITISMLLYLIIWVIFIEIYISKYGRNKLAITCGAVLVSSYSILCCHLAPKCYVMLFRKELNNESAIAEYIRKHYEQKGMNVVNG